VGLEGEVGVLVVSRLWRGGVDAMSCGFFWRKCKTELTWGRATTLVTLAQFEFEPVMASF
jgi:phage head maturation protease